MRFVPLRHLQVRFNSDVLHVLPFGYSLEHCFLIDLAMKTSKGKQNLFNPVSLTFNYFRIYDTLRSPAPGTDWLRQRYQYMRPTEQSYWSPLFGAERDVSNQLDTEAYESATTSSAKGIYLEPYKRLMENRIFMLTPRSLNAPTDYWYWYVPLI